MKKVNIYPEIAKLPQTTSKHVIIAVKSMFARHGIPDEVRVDNGSQFTSKECRAQVFHNLMVKVSEVAEQ